MDFRALLRHATTPALRARLRLWLPRAVERRVRQAARPRHQHEHPSYTEAELLARTDEFNKNAETHWQTISRETAGRAHVLNKPFSTVRDTPDILYRLGLVLSALDLGVGHTVVDFGSGSCWLSSCINRLRCRTISIDVSPTALKIGEELFRSDARHHMELEPRFLAYDGRRLSLPDASVDRAVCFDSFHHVPNQDEVLSELSRILRPGGRVVMAEPGEDHSHMDQSIYETEAHGVLENDIHLGELAAKAKRAGFTEVWLKPYPDPAAITLPAEHYLRLVDGDDSAYPMATLQDSLRHFYIIIFTKGEPRIDSRNPRELRAAIEVPATALALTGVASGTLRFQARATNTGDTIWLHEKQDVGGYVMLGGHLWSAERKRLHAGYLRAALPRDVMPGQSVEVEVALPLPDETGRFFVQLDMVDEFVAWFEQCGSSTVEIALHVDSYPTSRDPHRLAAGMRLVSGRPSGPVTPGAALQLCFELANTGDSTWLAGEPAERGVVSLGAHLVDGRGAVVAQDYARVRLPRDVEPKQRLALEMEVAAPPETGRHALRFDLVAEGVCWFEHMGGAPLVLPVETNAETPDSRNPGVLRAAIEVLEIPAPARPGSELSLRVRLRNAGNTLWRGGDKSRGSVTLGGRLSLGGAVLDADFLHAPLPKDVAPGDSLECEVRFAAPEEAGCYALELDMVAEGIAWFASRGSKTVPVELNVG
jgi:SAM-dependent methyltransferase